jgi:hypothetical protein
MAGIASPNFPSVDHGEAGSACLGCQRTNLPTSKLDLAFAGIGERLASRVSRYKNYRHWRFLS